MNVQHTEKGISTTTAILIIVLCCGIIMGFALGVVWGAEIPASYDYTVALTNNAANATEGFMIDNYIETVKKDICKTLTNATEYEGCMNL